jgi:hypothetical protein
VVNVRNNCDIAQISSFNIHKTTLSAALGGYNIFAV